MATYRQARCSALIVTAGLLAAAPVHAQTARTVVSITAPARAGESAEGKKIIEWGFDQPNTTRFRQNISIMEKTPFDGVVLAAYGLDAAKKPVDLAWKCFSNQPMTRAEFEIPLNDLKETHRTRFTDNFLRLNITPGDVDFFDDAGWKIICDHAALASWLCKEGDLRGVMFDTEEYDSKHRVWYYYDEPGHEKHTFDQYRKEAEIRGKEFAQALTSERHDLNIMMTFTGTFQLVEEKAPIQYSSMGLLPSFIDGMLEGANPDAEIIDALEHAYNERDTAGFKGLATKSKRAAEFSVVKDKYKARMKVAFGIWMDKDWKTVGWDPNNILKNYYTPDAFQKTVHDALELTDKYVWIYTEKVNWWDKTGLNPLYARAIEHARE